MGLGDDRQVAGEMAWREDRELRLVAIETGGSLEEKKLGDGPVAAEMTGGGA